MSDSAPAPVDREPARRAGGAAVPAVSWPFVLAIVVISLQFARFPYDTHPLTTDIRYFAYFARLVSEGGVPHQDYFDNKTQLAAFAGALFLRVGHAVGADPLIALRVGYLLIGVIAGLLLYQVQRRLWAPLPMAGWIGMAPYLGLPLLGLMPAIGNIPKLIMATAASGAALTALHGRWVWAGVLATLAALDWQIGGLVGMGLMAAALLEPRAARLPAVGGTLLGAALALLPFLAFFWAHGALDALWQQTVIASFFRGTTSLGEAGIVSDWPRRLAVLESAAYGGFWLLLAAIPGALAFAWQAFRVDPIVRRLAVTLGVYHYGLVAFSGVDFQANGDAFALFHSVAFLAGAFLNLVVAVSINRVMHEPGTADLKVRPTYEADAGAPGGMADLKVRPTYVESGVGDGGATAGRASPSYVGPYVGRTFRSAITRALSGWPGVVLVSLIVIAVWRPWLQPSKLSLIPHRAGERFKLSDQRELASRLERRLAGRRVFMLGIADLLFLSGIRNAAPTVFWNSAAYGYFRKSPDEPGNDALIRFIKEADPDILVVDQEGSYGDWGLRYFRYVGREVTQSGVYGVLLYRVRDLDRPYRPPSR